MSGNVRISRAGAVTSKRSRALVALLEGKSQVAAARAAGVTDRTLRRWLTEDDAFVDELAAMQNDVVRASKRILRGKVADAASVVVEILQQGTQKDRIRLAAAQDVLDRILGKAPARAVGIDDDERPPLLVQFIHPRARAEAPTEGPLESP